MTKDMSIRHVPLALAVAIELGKALTPALAQTDHFVIDAQVRGMFKRDFTDIGTASLTYTSGREAAFRVQGDGRVSHPIDASIKFEYSVDMQFQIKGNTLRYVSKKNTSNEAGKELLSGIERIVPFVYLVKMLPRAPKGYTMSTPSGTYSLSYNSQGTEVGLTRDKTEVGRFFIQPAVRRFAQLQRFRITRSTGTNLLFTVR